MRWDVSFQSMMNRFPLRPIKDDLNLEAAEALIEELRSIENRTQDQQDYMEVLDLLIYDYNRAFKKLDGRSVLESMLAKSGMSQRDLAEGSGISDTTISNILCGKRPISRKTRKALATYFKTREEVFI